MRTPRQTSLLETTRRGGRLVTTILAVAGLCLAGAARGQIFTEFALSPLGASLGGPGGITAGPDGNLWFTETVFAADGPSIGKIGRITTAGVITEFALPADSSAGDITAGPDGNLWFNEGKKIGRITTAGVIMEFALPAANTSILGIAAGPDGNLWFTETVFTGGPSTGKIGRITTAGVITRVCHPL